jgi:hypothetical protein
MALIAAPPVEAGAAADPVRETLADAAALPEPGAGVTLAVCALLDALPAAVFEAADELAPAEPLCVSFSAPAVTVTLYTPTVSYVVVLLPGKFASLPAADSLHTAVLASTTQSWVAVKSSPGVGSDISMLNVLGP